MARIPNRSAQTQLVLRVLSTDDGWRHGYDLARETGLKSGTLYPILRRLGRQGLLESRWEDDPPEGRPRRHLHRLTADGVTAAREAVKPAQPSVGAPAWSG